MSPRFTPKAGHYYQFLLSAGYRTGMCTMHATLIERDADGQGWHLSPNPDVTYSSGSNESKTLYIFEPRRETPNPVYQPVGRPSFPTAAANQPHVFEALAPDTVAVMLIEHS